MRAARLFNDGQNIALADDDVFFAVHFYFRASVLGVDDALPSFDMHRNLLAVYIAARAHCDHFRNLRLFLRRSGPR